MYIIFDSCNDYYGSFEKEELKTVLHDYIKRQSVESDASPEDILNDMQVIDIPDGYIGKPKIIPVSIVPSDFEVIIND